MIKTEICEFDVIDQTPVETRTSLKNVEREKKKCRLTKLAVAFYYLIISKF